MSTFKLPMKKVRVRPNLENSGWIKNPRHAAFFKVEGAYESYPVAMLKSGQLKNPFTDEEKVFLEEHYGYEPNTLSVYKKDSPLREINVRLTKDGMALDLSNPDDYIIYKVLLTNSEKIAPSVKERKSKATYKFYIEDEAEIAEMKSSDANINQIAWMEYGKISENKSKLTAFLKIYSQVFKMPTTKIDKNTDIKILQGKVSDIVKDKMQGFVEIVTNPDYETMLLISEAVENGVIVRTGTKYSLAEGDQIGNTFKEAIQYLKAPVNQELILILEEQIKLKS
jgi:hypothetical protein